MLSQLAISMPDTDQEPSGLDVVVSSLFDLGNHARKANSRLTEEGKNLLLYIREDLRRVLILRRQDVRAVSAFPFVVLAGAIAVL